MENEAEMASDAEDISSEDVEEAIRLLKEIPTLASGVSSIIDRLTTRIKNDELPTEKGLSFLELKNHTFLNYVMNLSYLMQKKISGEKIEGSPAIERIVESRTVLEKIKPIHEKLKYQIDKSTTVPANLDPSDPLRFKPNPDNLEAQEEEEEEDDEQQEEEETKSNVYVPPKISAAYFDEKDTLEERKKKILERAQRKALSSNVMHELRKEYQTGPEEIKETIEEDEVKISKKMKEHLRYEEEYMTRIPMTKKQKHEARRMTTVTNFSMKFDDVSALDKGTGDISMKRRSSGRKDNFAKKHGKKKGKKRKR